MGSLFRSEEMSLVQLFIQYEAAQATVNELGEIGLVQFRDLNEGVNAFQRTFVSDIKRCDEMERKIRFLNTHIERLGLHVQAPESHLSRQRTVQEMDELEATLRSLETEISQLNKNEEALNKNHLELVELQHVLRETEQFFTGFGDSHVVSMSQGGETPGFLEDTFDRPAPAGSGEPLGEASRIGRLGFVTGILIRNKRPAFERILWRALRGNLYMKQEEIEDPITDPVSGETHAKNVFIIFCQGEQLRNKIRKLCEAFGAKLYPCPDTPETRKELMSQVAQRITDLDNVLSKTTEHRRRVLSNAAENLGAWTVMVRKEKAIYHAMNMFNVDVTSKCFIGEGWCPTADLERVRGALYDAANQSQTMVPSVLNVIRTALEPPTYNRNNKFTKGFQVIIDAYGMGKYREVNPTPFAIITFPFLFAVMFGDFGHGILMTLTAAYLIYKERLLQTKTKEYGEIFATIFSGRYIILLMGLFSMYTGLIYNDMFSKALPIFPTQWEFGPGDVNNSYVGKSTGGVYAFGIDYAWHGAENMLVFLNSYKMKMAVIFGVMHMSFGIILSCFNYVFFKQRVSVYHEFIPQMIFLQSIFGYLTICIIYKWCSDWSTSRPPSLLNMLINMFLSPGYIDEPLYSGQATIQIILLALALIAVPWMLLVKPLVKLAQHKRTARDYSTLHNEDHSHVEVNDGESETGVAADQHGEGFEFGELMIHQVIHTIEFCLGAISNTASYLRLWALSLAHAQLSDVLWTMTIGKMMDIDNAFMQALGLFGAFSAWFALTLVILLTMEGLSAFLHALRLHWVEFNQKFYAASGYAFVPFSFERSLNDDAD